MLKLTALGLGIVIAAAAVYASTSTTLAVGTIVNYPLFGSDATVTMRRLTINPGEVLGWHAHPGIGAVTVVTRGTLTVEDGCGEVLTYGQGQAFQEAPNRVHRGKNLTTDTVETMQTFVVPTGDPFSEPHQQMCGYPISVDECRDGGWARFDYPRAFNNQGDCQQFVITGR